MSGIAAAASGTAKAAAPDANRYLVDPQVPVELKAWKQGRKYRWVQFGLVKDAATGKRKHVVIQCEPDKKKGVDDLVAALPAADSRFIVYDHEFKASDGRATGKLFFICWNPRRYRAVPFGAAGLG